MISTKHSANYVISIKAVPTTWFHPEIRVVPLIEANMALIRTSLIQWDIALFQNALTMNVYMVK